MGGCCPLKLGKLSTPLDSALPLGTVLQHRSIMLDMESPQAAAALAHQLGAECKAHSWHP